MTGVHAAQVSLDDGDTWETAKITYPGTKLIWVRWRYDWTPKETAEVSLNVRCIDGRGGI